MLNEKKVNKLVDYMGYYMIETSKLDKNELDKIEKYHGLSRIEDQFRILKCDLDTRPIHVSTREHITAHFTICFIAVVMIRLLQHRIKEYEGIKDDIENWNMAFLHKEYNVHSIV